MLTISRRIRSRRQVDDTTVQALRRIDADMERFYALIADRLESAIVAFLAGEREAAAALVASDPEIDSRQLDLELLVRQLPASAAIELGLVARFLERLGDHAVNVTRRIPLAAVGSTVGATA